MPKQLATFDGGVSFLGLMVKPSSKMRLCKKQEVESYVYVCLFYDQYVVVQVAKQFVAIFPHNELDKVRNQTIDPAAV